MREFKGQHGSVRTQCQRQRLPAEEMVNLSGLEEENSNLSKVEVDEVLRLMGNV